MEKRKDKREFVHNVTARGKVSSAPHGEFLAEIVNYGPDGLAFYVHEKYSHVQISAGDYVILVFNEGSDDQFESLFEVVHVSDNCYGCRREQTQTNEVVKS